MLLVAVGLAAALNTCSGKAPVKPQVRDPALQRNEVTIDNALAELGEMECPEGVNAALWVELKDALKEALQTELTESKPGSPARLLASPEEQDGHSMLCPYKWVSTPPTGEANRVDDLAILDNGDGTFTLFWHYQNLGDYDQNGAVGIEDITPLAMHYGESYEPTDANCLLAVIDGSGNGTIDIADITPIAIHFAVDVHHYAIEGAAEETGLFELVSEIAQDAGAGEGRLEYSVIIESPAALWHRVVPCDAEGTPGEPSNAVLRPSNEPIIYEVSPTEGYQHEEYTFSATVTGAEPLTYAWDFGGGATPDTSAESSPTVMLADAGEYAASLTVTNAYGEASHPFTLTVSERDMWAHTWGGFRDEEAEDICIDDAGNVYVLAYTNSFGIGADDVLLLKYSPQGDLLWSKTWGTEVSDSPAGLVLIKDKLIVAGDTYVSGEQRSDVVLLTYDLDGQLLSQVTWGTGDYERASALAADSGGNLYVVGYTLPYGSDDHDLLIASFTVNGEFRWAKCWDRGYEDSASGVMADPTGSLYVCGGTESLAGVSGDALILKYDAEGNILWGRTWDAGHLEGAASAALDRNGDLFIGGGQWNLDEERSYGILLRLAADGDLAFSLRTDGAGGIELGPDSGLFGRGQDASTGQSRGLVQKFDQDGHSIWCKVWNADWSWGFCFGWDVDGNGYFAGCSDSNGGVWEDKADAEATAIGGTIEDAGGTGRELYAEMTPAEGVETSPEGTQDTGGGSSDVLLIKNIPW